MNSRRTGARRMLLISGLVGGMLVLISAVFFFADVITRGGAVVPRDVLPPPDGWAGAIGRAIAAEITPIFWAGWVLVLCGAAGLVRRRQDRGRGEVDATGNVRPIRLVTCFVGSVGIWLVFDWYNFSFMQAWDYHGLAADPLRRYLAFFVAFGAICPAMFLTANVLLSAGFRSVQGPRLRIGVKGRIALTLVGVLCAAYPLLVARPIGALTVWLAFLLVLDPINARLGVPSVLGDLAAGRWGRPLALMSGGFACGLLWEFWNFWATAKWTYNLPFLGPLETVRYFEMPVIGMLGYLPFALECWAMFQMLAFLLRRAGILRIEPLPENAAV